MSVYDELGMFWGALVFLICVSVYTTGYLCYKLGYKDGESNAAKNISRQIEKEIRRGDFRRLR